MLKSLLIDNDVALKSCAYKWHSHLIEITTLQDNPPAMLSLAKFTLRSRLKSQSRIVDRGKATAALDQLLSQVILLEPTQNEVELAAILEEQATEKALEFDMGESQLIAILLLRGAPLFLTGDKRAICALAALTLPQVNNRLICFEQFIKILLTRLEYKLVRQCVCAEPNVDRAVTNCFSCSSSSTSVENIIAGLASYINHLRSQSGDVLIKDIYL